MDWLNFHHLRYFHVVVRDGSIARASRTLHVSPSSISTQLRQLEHAFGERLLQKQGRGLVPTEMGRLVFGYAEQIFTLGRDLLDTVKDRPSGRPVRVQVGIADVVPKELAFQLLQPLLDGDEPVRCVVREDRPERLLADLATFQLDLVVTDHSPAAGRVRVFQHPLGASPVGVYGARALVKSRRRGFPASLQGAPFVLPLDDSELRREFETFRQRAGLAVEVRAEVEDSALAKTLAVAGHGLVLAPTVLGKSLAARGLWPLGELPGVTARYLVLTVERRVKHPAVARLLAAARQELFG